MCIRDRFYYDDLLRFSDYMPVHDKDGNDTLWLNVYYPEFEHAEIEANLNKIYTLLHSCLLYTSRCV